jgi:hypothetical protein
MFNLDYKTENSLSVIKDPFLADNITKLYIFGRYDGGKFTFMGCVEFLNGSTYGEQRTEDCDTFEECVSKIKQIFNEVNSKQ